MPTTTSAVGDLRAAAADLELIAAARAAAESADAHLSDTVRQVRARGRVTVEQIGQELGIGRRAVYKRLGRG